TPRRLACYPLAPWSNRIGSGGFDTPDGWFALPANSANDPLPIHGTPGSSHGQSLSKP
ncbi:hypothetical protein F2S88_29045, partial [Pseudomonas syringae pv. actinidiae]|nr:hypothetical protein [Pseudomonas syringae pv. actinidiae]